MILLLSVEYYLSNSKSLFYLAYPVITSTVYFTLLFADPSSVPTLIIKGFFMKFRAISCTSLGQVAENITLYLSGLIYEKMYLFKIKIITLH